ncbi:MAG: HD domain-containing protein, partial [Bacteroidota bacterium]
MIEVNDRVEKAKLWVKKHFTENVPDQYVYHNYQHAVDVAQSAVAISSFYKLTEAELAALHIAAYFHDSGYDQGSIGHEDRGKTYARSFLESEATPEEEIILVEGLIEATKPQITPQTLLQKILKDADISHVGSDHYWDRCSRVRQELLLTQQEFMSEDEWVDFELQFIQRHQFITDAAYTLYQEKKKKNISRLKKYAKRVHKAKTAIAEQAETEVHPEKKKKKKKKTSDDIELKQINLGRGVETMYRTTYRTHLNLSAIADNKANIMLSINAIIISIAVSNLVPQFNDNKKLIIPTAMLLGVCLVALVFAILSTRPKITEG